MRGGVALWACFSRSWGARALCFGSRRLTRAGAAGRVLWRNGALDVESTANKVKRARGQLA